MSKVKITVIKKFSPIDVFGYEMYSTSGTKITQCSAFDDSQEFIVDHIENMPEDFCHHAWYGLYKNVSILQYGGGFPTWTGENMIYTACPDGIRPVCFKLERISD